jgi:ribonuclease BN (tRNA processing enzyme)
VIEEAGATEPALDRPGCGGSLTVLGCDGSYPGPGGAASGYLVEAAGVTLWLDAGPGTFANLQLVVDPRSVDAVVLSHEHPDHWADVSSFAAWLREAAIGRPVPVYAPPGLRERVYFGDDPVLAWHVVEPAHRVALRPPELDREPHGGSGAAAARTASGSAHGIVCSFSATDHGPPTLAVRIDRPLGPDGGEAGGGGRAVSDRAPSSARDSSLGYTADTGPDWSVEELGAGIGTLLCEATYTRDHEGEARHLSGRQAGAMAAAAGVGQLVLTHRRPTIQAGVLAAEADEAFGRPVHQATPGRVFEW